MFNKKLYSFVYLALIFSTIYGKIMTKDEVKKINLDDFKGKEENQCPDISSGYYGYLDRCSVEIYCKDDVCSSATRTGYKNSTVEFPDANGNMKTYIAEIYDETDTDTPKCQSDSDCLSNKCVNNYCVRNDDIKLEKCQDTYYYNILFSSSSIKMTCGKPDDYSCKRDSDCASNDCSQGLCAFQGRVHNFDFIGSYILYGVILIIAIILACIGCCCCCCKHKNKRSVKATADANTV